jgi:hypothetical protein
MTLSQTQQAPHRRARAVSSAVRDGQFTGALLTAGGVATPELGHRDGAWAGPPAGLVMLSTFRARPGGVLAIAADSGAAERKVRRSPGL